jgi:hypothetical protein
MSSGLMRFHLAVAENALVDLEELSQLFATKAPTKKRCDVLEAGSLVFESDRPHYV